MKEFGGNLAVDFPTEKLDTSYYATYSDLYTESYKHLYTGGCLENNVSKVSGVNYRIEIVGQR